jgi:hypothetical protein
MKCYYYYSATTIVKNLYITVRRMVWCTVLTVTRMASEELKEIVFLYLSFGVKFGLVKPGLKSRYAIHFTETLGNKCNASSTSVRPLSGNSTVYRDPTRWPTGPCLASWSWPTIRNAFSLLMEWTLHGSGDCLIPGQSMRVLWWTERYWNSFFSERSVCIIPPILHSLPLIT